MKESITRRELLKMGVAGGAGTLLTLSAARNCLAAAEGPAKLCLTICNHWSYIGIGWQLGIESCVLSVTDGMEMVDRPPHVKTCINLDARAYEFMAEKFPEVTQRLKKYLAAGKLELIAGTYGQPMGTTISGEANIRQIVVGREVIRKALDYDVATFLEEEEFTHPQIPQIAALAGYRYASLAQVDTWGRAGCPRINLNAVYWKGIDGTTILSVPKNALFGFSPDIKQLAASADFKKLAALGKPLIFAWEEFGWESAEQPAYLTSPAKYQGLAGVEYVTIKEYLDKYGAQAQQTVYLPMDAWNKSLTWGLGGDQVRIFDRKLNGLLLAAELFDAVAAALGGTSQAERLDEAWRHALAAQSHDVGLCEYSRWQGDRMAPLDRIEDRHNFPWGVIGYQHMDAAQKDGQEVLDGALRGIAARVNTASPKHGSLAAVVFNPHAWQRSDVVSTGRLYPVPPASRDVVVKDRSGQAVPSQIVKRYADAEKNLVMAEVAFLAREVPSVGYDAYYLEFASEPVAPAASSLRVDESKLTLENDFLRVGIDALSGGVASLFDKRAGHEMLSAAEGAFPRFFGRPNPKMPLRPDPPSIYGSAKSKARIDWLAKGPLFATIRAQHKWPYLHFETRVSLAVGQPYVEVTSRVLAMIPPKPDAAPADIKEGYWLSLLPGFPVVQVLRDFPFGVEETKNPAFHALTFVDLLGGDLGLLVLHMGTQYFRREASGAVSNLVMREWESTFSKEYGWPNYCEYRHALLPHGGTLSNADRWRAAAAFAQPLACVVGAPHDGDLPPLKTFLEVQPSTVQLSAFRKQRNGGYELRLAETEGRRADAVVAIHLPLTKAVESDLAGHKRADAAIQNGKLSLKAEPWKIRNFRLE